MTFIKLIFACFVITLAANGLAYAKFGGVQTVSEQTSNLDALIEQMPFVSPGISDEKVIYKISFRDCTACVAYHRHEFPKLQALGVDTRQFVFAPPSPSTTSNERAVVAELYKNRDWQLLSDWFEVNNQQTFFDHISNAPAADGNRSRIHAIAQGQRQYLALARILESNDIKVATPILLWKQDAQWKAVVGNAPLTNALIRKAFKD